MLVSPRFWGLCDHPQPQFFLEARERTLATTLDSLLFSKTVLPFYLPYYETICIIQVKKKINKIIMIIMIIIIIIIIIIITTTVLSYDLVCTDSTLLSSFVF